MIGAARKYADNLGNMLEQSGQYGMGKHDQKLHGERAQRHGQPDGKLDQYGTRHHVVRATAGNRHVPLPSNVHRPRQRYGRNGIQ